MIDIRNEELVRLEDIRDHLPSSRRGKRLGKAVAYRWASRGARGVVLETLRIGGGRFTSREALSRFVAAQNLKPADRPPRAASATERDAAAAKELDRMGV